jgi:hypothetical protein
MKFAYFITQKDIAISTYEDLFHIQMNLQTLKIPSRVEYSSYINETISLNLFNVYQITFKRCNLEKC